MQKQVLQKTKKWPKDWEKHVLNSCKLYFDNKKIEFTDGSMMYSYITHLLQKYETTSLAIQFNIQGKKYEANVIRQNAKGENFPNDMIKTCIIYIENIEDGPMAFNNKENNFLFKTATGFLILQPIASFFCQTGYECATNIEKIITEDYNNRNNNDDDGEGENEPIDPFIPSDSLNLDPILNSY